VIERHSTKPGELSPHRKFDITASVIGAVRGCHPYVTPLRLFIEKQGLVDLPLQADNGVFRRGRIYEPAVAAAVAEMRPEWRLEKCQEYFRDEATGIGATPDFFIHGDPRGLGVLQTKTTIPSVYDRDWHDDDGVVRAPRYIELQAATEAMLTDVAFGAIGCLVLDPFDVVCVVIEFSRDPALEQDIRDRVAQFWKDIEDGREPDVDYRADRDLLAEVRGAREGLSVDLTFDNEVIDGLAIRKKLKAQIKEAEEACKKVEGLVMSRMRDAVVATVPGFSVTWKVRPRKEYVVPASAPRVLDIRTRGNGGSS
jgi:predicted phage-related endonuclease